MASSLAPPLAGLQLVPDSIRRFILTSVPSVPYLEAALLFQRAPDAARSGAEVARLLYIPRQRAAELLAMLCDAGVVAAAPDAEPLYRYAPSNPELASHLAALARLYETDMIEITHLIHDASGKNAIRFADAFKLRKGE